MPSYFTDIRSYWASNAALSAAVPANNVWVGIAPAPPQVAYPYVVLTALSTVPSFTTGPTYYATFTFQLSIFDTNPDEAEAIGQTVINEFDYALIAPGAISMERRNGPNLLADTDTAKRVWHVFIEYDYLRNEYLGNAS